MVYSISKCVEIVPKDKASVIVEIFVAFVASIPFFTSGIQSTFLSPSEYSDHLYAPDGPIWTSVALVAATTLSAPAYCLLVDQHGRRSGLFVIILLQGASLIPLFLMNPISMLVLHALAGAAAGGLFTVQPAYIVEITSVGTRGFCMLLMMAMTTLGYMTRLVMTLEERMYVMTALVMLQLIFMAWICESPSFLMMKGKEESSKKTMSRLRRLPEDSPSLQKQIGVLRDECERVRARGRVDIFIFYRNKIMWDALKIGLCLYIVSTICGSVVFLDQAKTLMQLGVEEESDNTLVLTALAAGSLASLTCVLFLDRKYILTIGYIVMAVSSGVLAVYTQVDLTVTDMRWVPVVALAALVLGYGMSWGLHVIILAELYETELRTTMLAVLLAISQIIKLAHVTTFEYLEESVGLYTMFYIFAGINLYGAVYTLFAVPKIRNKTMKQIAKQLKRIPLPA